MSVAYLSGGERPTVAQMNSLYGEFELRLQKLLRNKSPALVLSTGAIPRKLLGKTFFFTSGPTYYAQRFPGFISDGAGGAEPYDDTVFTSYTPTVLSYDETNKVAIIDEVPSGDYGAIAKATFFGFYDHSLRTHYELHQGSVDNAPVPYYYRETNYEGATPYLLHAERHHQYAVAEIILEGVTSLTWLEEWDKYPCLRFHNLNPAPASVTFAGMSSPRVTGLTIEPFGCRTVRRWEDTDDATWDDAYKPEGYRECRYFFPFRTGGDGRFFLNHDREGQVSATNPTRYVPVDTTSGQQTPGGTFHANNLSNPLVLLDWIQWLEAPTTPHSDTRFAWWQEDPHEQCDIKAKLLSSFPGAANLGTPSEGTTPVGDLIHHSGKVIVVKIHKTLKVPGAPTIPQMEFSEFTFEGYGTLAAKLLPYGITVSTPIGANEDTSYFLRLTNTNTNWDIDLVPIGTNFLAFDDTAPNADVGDIGNRLKVASIAASGTLDLKRKLFEDSKSANGSWLHKRLGTQRVFATSRTTVGASGYLYARMNGDTTTDVTYTDSTETSTAQLTVTGGVTVARNASALGCRNFRDTVVNDLTSLRLVGNLTATPPADGYVSYADAAVTLTPSGLVLTWNEVRNLATPWSLSSGRAYITDWTGMPLWVNGITGSQLKIKRIERFRNHGFGWADGSDNAAFAGGRHPWYKVVTSYENESFGEAGGEVSFRIVRADPSTVSPLQVVRRKQYLSRDLGGTTIAPPVFDPALMEDYAGSPFLQLRLNDVGPLLEFEEKYDSVTLSGFNIWYVGGNRTAITSGLVERNDLIVPLLPEHYNLLAREVNARKRGRPLNWQAIAIYVPSRSAFVKPERHLPSSKPLPVDCWSQIRSSTRDDQIALWALLGVPVLTVTDLPASFASARDTAWQYSNFRATVELDIDAADGDTTLDVTVTKDAAANGRITSVGAAPGSGTDAALFNTPVERSTTPWASGLETHDNPVGLPASASNGTVLTLTTEYNSIEWVADDDVEAAFDDFDLPLVTEDVFIPLQLRTLNMPDDVTAGAYGSTSISYSTGANDWLKNIRLSFGSQFPASREMLWTDHTRLNAWIVPANAGDADWKIPVAGFDGSVAMNPQVFDLSRSADNSSGDASMRFLAFRIKANLSYTFSPLGSTLSITLGIGRDVDGNSEPSWKEANDAHYIPATWVGTTSDTARLRPTNVIHVEFDGTTQEFTDFADYWRTYFRTRRFLVYKCVESGGLGIDQGAIFYPIPFDAWELQWWTSSASNTGDYKHGFGTPVAKYEELAFGPLGAQYKGTAYKGQAVTPSPPFPNQPRSLIPPVWVDPGDATSSHVSGTALLQTLAPGSTTLWPGGTPTNGKHGAMYRLQLLNPATGGTISLV